jgi:hypothetical protein
MRHAAGDELTPTHLGKKGNQVIGRDDKVTIQKPFESAADSVPVNRSDNWLVRT